MADDNVQTQIDDPAIEAVEIKVTVLDEQEKLVHAALGRADLGLTSERSRVRRGRRPADQDRPRLLHNQGI